MAKKIEDVRKDVLDDLPPVVDRWELTIKFYGGSSNELWLLDKTPRNENSFGVQTNFLLVTGNLRELKIYIKGMKYGSCNAQIFANNSFARDCIVGQESRAKAESYIEAKRKEIMDLLPKLIPGHDWILIGEELFLRDSTGEDPITTLVKKGTMEALLASAKEFKKLNDYVTNYIKGKTNELRS